MFNLNFLNRFFPLFLIFIASIFTILPFFDSGFFIIHDNTQIQRTFEMAKSLSDGMFPVRWVSDLGYGYGYPIFNYYAPVFYYASGLLTVLGFSALISTKIAAIAAILLSAFSMYLLAKEFWGRWGGIFSAVLYAYAPFHAVDIFVRGDFAELLAYGLLPLPLLGVYKIYKEKLNHRIWLWVGFTSIAFALVISSHNLTAFMLTPFILIEAVILGFIRFSKEKKLPKHIFYSVFLGILIAAFYWIPALLELKFTNVFSIIGGGSDFRDHFVCLSQFWYSPWGFAGSGPGCIDGISFEIGKIHLTAVLVSAIGLIPIRKNMTQFYVVLLMLLMFFVSLFLMINHSKLIWELLGPMKFFQFPWRLLLLASFSASLLGGFSIWLISKKIRSRKFLLVFTFFLVISSVFYYQRFFYPQSISRDPSLNYTNEQSLKWFTSRISDEYMPENFPRPPIDKDVPGSKIKIQDNTGEVTKIQEKTGIITVSLRLDTSSQVVVNIANFPAWSFYLNNKKIEVEKKEGKYRLNLPQGVYELKAKFAQTQIEKISNIISLCGIGFVFAGIIFSRKKINEST